MAPINIRVDETVKRNAENALRRSVTCVSQ